MRVDADVQQNEVMERLSLDLSTHPTLDDPEDLLAHVFFRQWIISPPYYGRGSFGKISLDSCDGDSKNGEDYHHRRTSLL